MANNLDPSQPPSRPPSLPPSRPPHQEGSNEIDLSEEIMSLDAAIGNARIVITGSSQEIIKYLEEKDIFVKLKKFQNPEVSISGNISSITGKNYQKAVIRECVVDLYRDNVLKVLYSNSVEQLYELCVKENPTLALESVTIRQKQKEKGNKKEDPSDTPVRSKEDIGKLSLPDARRHIRRHLHTGGVERIQDLVIGQERAIAKTSGIFVRIGTGIGSKDATLGSALFLGPSGVGKTSLAKAISNEFFGGNIFTIEGGSLRASHEVLKLTGAPPSYVGYDSKVPFVEHMRKTPFTVVLIDELEKAHPDFHGRVLSLLDEGSMSVGDGRDLDFSRALILITSNIGDSERRAQRDRIGFDRTAMIQGVDQRRYLSQDQYDQVFLDALESRLPPELIGRIHEKIVFSELKPEDARTIAGIAVKQLSNLNLFPDIQVLDWIVENCFRDGASNDTGARSLNSFVRDRVGGPLAHYISSKPELSYRKKIYIFMRGDSVTFRLRK